MKEWLKANGLCPCRILNTIRTRTHARQCLFCSLTAALLSLFPLGACADEPCTDGSPGPGGEQVRVVKMIRSPIGVLAALLGVKAPCPQDALVGRLTAADRERALQLVRNPYAGPAIVHTYVYR